ncbi:MAG: c-type cytochrome [Sulfurifustis sp.]
MISSALAALLAAATLSACEGVMHDMYEQPKYRPLEPSELFADGRSARPPVEGATARLLGSAADASSGRRGTATPLDAPAPAIDRALLEHGRERFDIYCSPCHGRAGDSDGMVVRRGFPAPPSYHSPRLREAPDRHFYEVITHGYGAMASYADRVPPADRWAIAAYIRALQLSQAAPVAALTAAERERLERGRR